MAFIKKKMIYEANKIVFKDKELERSILNPFFGYAFNDSMLFELRLFYHGINATYKDKIKRDNTDDKSTDTLSEFLIKLFPSPDGNLSIFNDSNYSVAQKYFSKKESRSRSIKIFSSFFIYILKEDKIFSRNQIFIFEEESFFPLHYSIVNVFNTFIFENKEILAFSLLTLHAFMLEVLDTEEELIEYITNIYNKISEEDKKIIKTSSLYFLKFTNEESHLDELSILNTLYHIPDKNSPYNFHDVPTYGRSINLYDRLADDFDESSKFIDSVSITLLHLCNFLFFNSEKEQFDLEHLNLDKESNLLKFYTKYKRPFHINQKIRLDWTKVTQCLNDIVCGRKNNKNLGEILYKDYVARNELDFSIFNIVTVLTKLCMSRKNKIKDRYIDLFNKTMETDKFLDLFQSFINFLVNKDINVSCSVENLEAIENKIYGIVTMTRTLNKEEKHETQMKFYWLPSIIYTEFISKESSNLEDLQNISFKLKTYETLHSLRYVIVKYVNDLKNKTFKNYNPGANYRFFNRSLLVSNSNKDEYLHYLFDKLDGTNLNNKIFNIVEMVIKYALVEINEKCKELEPFYIKIDDLKSDLSTKEKIDCWIYLLSKPDLYNSINLYKLWLDEIKVIKGWGKIPVKGNFPPNF